MLGKVQEHVIKIFFMKIIHFITHPLFLIAYFLLLVISGESLSNFYCFYIVLALLHGGIHSMLAVLGIGILVFSYAKYKNNFNYKIEPILNIGGALLLLSSLFSFFYTDVDRYNYGTFYETVPLTILIVFILVELTFLIKNFMKIGFKMFAV